MERFSQSTSWTLAEELRHLKGQERSPHNQVGWKKEEEKRKRRGSGTGPAPLRRGLLKERRGYHIQGSLLTGEEIRWDRRGALGAIRGEHSNRSVAGRTEWDLQRGFMPQPCMPCLRHVSTGVDGGWVLECGVWKANLGRGLLLAARRQPERTRVRKSTTGNTCGGSADRHRSEEPLLSDTQGAGPFAASLPTCQPLPPHALGRAPAGAGSLVPAAAGSPVCPVPTRAPVTPAATTSMPLLTRADSCTPGQPQKQTPVGGPHAEVGLKPQLSPRGHAAKEEKLKSLLTAGQTINWHHGDWLCKLSGYGTSKWTTSAPAAKTGLPLAAVDYAGTYTWGLGRPESELPP